MEVKPERPPMSVWRLPGVVVMASVICLTPSPVVTISSAVFTASEAPPAARTALLSVTGAAKADRVMVAMVVKKAAFMMKELRVENEKVVRIDGEEW